MGLAEGVTRRLSTNRANAADYASLILPTSCKSERLDSRSVLALPETSLKS